MTKAAMPPARSSRPKALLRRRDDLRVTRSQASLSSTRSVEDGAGNDQPAAVKRNLPAAGGSSFDRLDAPRPVVSACARTVKTKLEVLR